MYSAAFDYLLTGSKSSRVVWERGYRCPCVSEDGPDRKCVLCGGLGRYWDTPSDEFRCGVTTLTGKALANIQQRFGPGILGDAMVSLPGVSPAWEDVAEGDRFMVLDALDPLDWNLTPSTHVRLPMGADLIRARVRASDGLSVVSVDPPEPGIDGRIAVSVPTVISFRAPRRFEVVRDLAQVRTFGEGRMPKKMLLKLIDWTTR